MKKINTNGSESSLDFFSSKNGRVTIRPTVGDGVSIRDWFPPVKSLVCKNFNDARKGNFKTTVVYCRYSNQKIELRGLIKPDKLDHGFVLATYKK